MRTRQRLLILLLLELPLYAAGQEADRVVQRELYDPSNRSWLVESAAPNAHESPPPSGIRCGTGHDMDAAAIAEATERAAAAAAAFRDTGLRGYVEAQPVQPDVSGGIAFQITFINEGRKPIKLEDMTNAMSIVLFRKSPPVGHLIPSWTFHGTYKPEFKSEFPDTAEVQTALHEARKKSERNRPYLVEEPRVRSKGVRTLRDLREFGDVRLAPGRGVQIVVRITEGLADPIAYWSSLAEASKDPRHWSNPAADAPDLAPLVAGDYSLSFSVMVSVSSAGDVDSLPMRQHALLFCDAMQILLGH